VSVNVPRLGELSGTVSTLVGPSIAHCVMFLDVLLQFGEGGEGVGAH